MKVRDLAKNLELKILSGESGLDREIEGAYCGDLLSWVMSHGNRNNAWITVQIHPNIVAVALLVEFSCIIIPEEIEVEAVTVDKAVQEGIPILQSKDNAFILCGKLKDMGI